MTDNSITIAPCGPVDAEVRPPGSKSITNRSLICAALANGRSTLEGVLESEDTGVMIESLSRLGLEIDWDRAAESITVEGCGGTFPISQRELFVANSGTTMRFLTSMLTAGHGRFRLDGVDRMRQRPIQDLLDALNSLGADVRSESGNRCPPVLVHARGLQGGSAQIRGNISSQFLSGLLMAAPYARQPIELLVNGALVSKPYVKMTLAVMRSFGIDVADSDLNSFKIPARQYYQARRYVIEPDASAASYFWAAAAITQGRVTVTGLGPDALQGDVQFCDCLERMGCQVTRQQDRITVEGGPLRGIEVDMNAISDTAQTLSAVALFAEGPTVISGIGHNRFKETDRIADLARELRKLGADVEELPDGLRIVPQALQGARVATYQDHRMAMSLALVGLKVENVTIEDPDCTRKTYPNYFSDLKAICR